VTGISAATALISAVFSIRRIDVSERKLARDTTDRVQASLRIVGKKEWPKCLLTSFERIFV
jgi:hypothetical protein